MGWRDRYRQGSFRGIPFQIEFGDDERGQRLVIHEFPGRDRPYLEEMGKSPTTYVIDAFLVGDDYLDQRDRLQNACSKNGGGKLIHPFYGEKFVKCENIRTRHDKNEMRMVRVTMSFIEVDETNVPIVQVIDITSKVELTAREVIEAQKSTFEKVFDFASLPYIVAQQALTIINGAVSDVNKARALVAQVAEFAKEIEDISGALTSLVLDTQQLFDEFVGVITFGFLTESQNEIETPDIVESFNGLSDLFVYSPSVAITSPTVEAFNQMIRGVTIAQGAHLLSIAEFDSITQAEELRDKLFSAMDSMEEEDPDDQLYIKIYTLRADVEKNINERAITLPRVVELTLPEFLPALVLSYQLYGNVDQESAIVTRNHVANPGVLPSDVPLKVITNV